MPFDDDEIIQINDSVNFQSDKFFDNNCGDKFQGSSKEHLSDDQFHALTDSIEKIFCEVNLPEIEKVMKDGCISKYCIDLDSILIKIFDLNDECIPIILGICNKYGYYFDVYKKRLFSKYGNISYLEYLYLNGSFEELDLFEHNLNTQDFDCCVQDIPKRVISFIPTHPQPFILTKFLNQLINSDPKLWLKTVKRYIHLSSDTIAKAILILHRKGMINFSYTNKSDIFYAYRFLNHSEDFLIEIMYIFDDSEFLIAMLMNSITKKYHKLTDLLLTRLSIKNA